MAPAGSSPPRGPAGCRTRWARRTGARTASRPPRRARPAPRCGSWTKRRSRQSEGTATAWPRSGTPRCRRPRWRRAWRSWGSRRHPGAVPAAVRGDQLVSLLRPPGPLGVGMDRGRAVEQGLEDPPGLLDAVLAGEAGGLADHRGVQQHLVGGRPFTPFLGELHLEVDLLRLRPVAPLGVDLEPDPGRGVEFDHQLVRLRGPVAETAEAE